MPSACTGATDSLLLGFWRWSFCSRATPYKTSAPGRLMVLIRPPSLEPSTPDVRDPRAWVTLRRVLLLPRPSPRPSPLNGGREGSFQRRSDHLYCFLVAEAACVQDHVVVAR